MHKRFLTAQTAAGEILRDCGNQRAHHLNEHKRKGVDERRGCHEFV